MKKFLVAFSLIIFLTNSVAFASTLTERITASKLLIQRVTGYEVTDFWAMDFREATSDDGTVLVTRGSVELGNDGVKRRFMCHFVASNLTPLRLQIGNNVLYSVTGQ